LGVGEIIVAKHRNGATDSVRMRFVGEYARFENFDTFGDDFQPMGNNSMSVNTAFDTPSNASYVVKSKMDEIDDDSFDLSYNGDDTPF